MATPEGDLPGLTDLRDYLQVDAFLQRPIDAQALAAAIELGLIDHLQGEPGRRIEDLRQDIDADPPGLRLLLKLLEENRVVVRKADRVRLSPCFRRILPFFPLLRMKIEFSDEAAADGWRDFTGFIRSGIDHRRQSRMFRLFDYRCGVQETPENRERTRKWMRITTMLTRYEAPVAISLHDVSPYRRMLDIGGNSGEFALQVCRRNPRCTAVVFDLPVVCAIGRAHILGEPESSRIEFLPGDAFHDELPKGFDLVTFKSMLHDWPREKAMELLARAADALAPGGTVMIFERGPAASWPHPAAYSVLPMLLFFRSFRSPEAYTETLAALGFRNIRVQWIELDTPFFLVTAEKEK